MGQGLQITKGEIGYQIGVTGMGVKGSETYGLSAVDPTLYVGLLVKHHIGSTASHFYFRFYIEHALNRSKGAAKGNEGALRGRGTGLLVIGWIKCEITFHP